MITISLDELEQIVEHWQADSKQEEKTHRHTLEYRPDSIHDQQAIYAIAGREFVYLQLYSLIEERRNSEKRKEQLAKDCKSGKYEKGRIDGDGRRYG